MPGVYEQLALLTDSQAHSALNRLIAGYAERNPEFPVDDVRALAGILAAVGEEAGEPVSPRVDKELADEAAAERTLLVQLAGMPEQRSFVEGAIEHRREVLLEPITTALVMAGIILVLETQFDVKISRNSGKTEYDVHIGKKPTAKSIIGKIFSVFS